MLASLSCYFKDFNEGTPSLGVDFRQHYHRLDFRCRVNPDYDKTIRELLEDENTAALVPDLAAAVVSHLAFSQQKAGDYVGERLIQDALEYCHDILLDYGFHFARLQRLVDDSPPDRCYSMLILGCQDRPMLRSRVEAGYTLMRELRRPFRVIFSGRNPARDADGARSSKVRTVCEASEMEDMFFRFKAADSDGERVVLDSASALDVNAVNTEANLRGFSDAHVLDPSRRNRVFLVSSTSHLIKIAELVGRMPNPKHGEIERIVLVGGEHHSTPGQVPTPYRYLKTMMFDVFRHILRTGTPPRT